MKTLIKVLVVLLILGSAIAAAYKPTADWLKKRSLPDWRTTEVQTGSIVSVVNATGSVKPVLEVKVGSFVSGPIDELYVDFNEKVTAGQEMARIDQRLFQAAVDRDTALLDTRKAEVQRVTALLDQAINNENRSRKLRDANVNFISDSEMDQFHFARLSLEAQLALANASVKQSEANLQNSQANLDYTHITSPVDGIVIDRKIDKGQTLAAQFQTPEMFVVAPDMDKKIFVYASVDEADIGLIRDAQRRDMPVQFTVDAYPDDLFEGVIEEVRFNSTTTQNVVTYPVVVAAPNPELKLLPGMTAAISFRIDEREEILKIPNSALRFYPESKHVRKEDQALLEGDFDEPEAEDDNMLDSMLSASEKAEARQQRAKRHVWVVEGDLLRAVEIETGLSDSRYTEMVAGDLKVGQKLVTGIKPKKGWGG